LAQKLTQEEPGERIGVQRTQISKLEKRIFQKQIIMAQMNLTPLDDVLDKHFGKVGTPKRDAFESDVDEALHAYRLGEAIKKARIEQNLTQEQLGGNCNH
jgi:transcriptional regulator with XRE-family HTH domain